MSMFETILAFSLGILFVAGIAVFFTMGRDKINQENTMSALLTLRTNIEQVFSNGDFSELTTELAFHLAPEDMRFGTNQLKTKAGEDIIVTGASDGTYTIAVQNVSSGMCQALSSLSVKSWKKVENTKGTVWERSSSGSTGTVNQTNIVTCEDGSTVTYTAP